MSGDIEPLSCQQVRGPEQSSRALGHASPSWCEIGESFETLGKVGLAVAVGFSAAGLFCRLADQGKIRIPALVNLLLKQTPDTKLKR